MIKKKMRRAAALLTAASLFLVSCRTNLIATTMELNKTEGTVSVHDGKQKEIEPREQLDLYSGYQVETLKTSYAWINLDKVKLTKMDAESEIEITKKRNNLEILVRSGKLFFHISEPLKDDESLNIRTSSMIVGVRGTCGWVEESGQDQMRVYILEGTVGCRRDRSDKETKDKSIALTENLQKKLSLTSILNRLLNTLPVPGGKKPSEKSLNQEPSGESLDKTPSGESSDSYNTVPETPKERKENEDTAKAKNRKENVFFVECMGEDEQVYVSAGEMAQLTLSPEGEEQIIVSEFTVADIPDYIMEELLEDKDLKQKILEESGLDIDSAPDENSDWGDETSEDETPEGESPEEASFFLNNSVYYGDFDKCRLTSAQAQLFADKLQTAIASGQSSYNQYIADQTEFASYPFQSYAILYDAGDGIPGMFFSCGGYIGTMENSVNPGTDIVTWAPLINQTMFYLGEPDAVYYTGLYQLSLGDGYLFGGGVIQDGSLYEGWVYPLANGQMQNASTTASADYNENSFQVNGVSASESAFDQWRATWDLPSPIGYSDANDIGGSCWGMVPSQEVLDVLINFANQE